MTFAPLTAETLVDLYHLFLFLVFAVFFDLQKISGSQCWHLVLLHGEFGPGLGVTGSALLAGYYGNVDVITHPQGVQTTGSARLTMS